MERYKISNTKDPAAKLAARRHVPVTKLPKSDFIKQAILMASVLLLLGIFVVLVIARSHQGPASPGRNQSGNSATGQSLSGKGSNQGSGDKKTPAQTKTAAIAAIESKNLKSLKSQFASQLRIIIVTSGSKVIKSTNLETAKKLIELINSAENPWDWNLSADQLAGWINGPYQEYFQTDGSSTVVIGLAANGYVVSLIINADGQINSILVATDSNLLATGTSSSSQAPNTDVPPDNPTASD